MIVSLSAPAPEVLAAPYGTIRDVCLNVTRPVRLPAPFALAQTAITPERETLTDATERLAPAPGCTSNGVLDCVAEPAKLVAVTWQA